MVPVFYCDAMIADAASYSPSASKPKALVERWLAGNRQIKIYEPVPATIEQLCAAHDPDYVKSVLSGTKRNGFGNTLESVAASLPYTTGSMLSAALWALEHGGFACAPCSGFHHAGWSSGNGFCTFNGLIVTAMALHKSAGATRVGILDFDQHYGDGTDDIIRRLKLNWIVHYTAGDEYSEPRQATGFLRRIESLVEAMATCDVILYQAGADPHIDDPLGGWLTTEQLARRDRLVFSAARRLKRPVAWNLAGGYQKPLSKVLEIHDNTLLACEAEAWTGDSA